VDAETLIGKLDKVDNWIETNAPQEQHNILFKDLYNARQAVAKDDQATTESHLTNLGAKLKKIKIGKPEKAAINALLKEAMTASAASKPSPPLPKSGLVSMPQPTQMPWSKRGNPPGSLS